MFTVVLAYAFFAALWILLSDRAMGLIISDPDRLVRISMLKGWLFVAVTSLLLFFLVKRLIGQLAEAHQRELEHQRERELPPPMLVAIAEGSEDAIFAKDAHGRYVLFNNAAARFVGKPVIDVLGRDDHALFPPEQADMLAAIGRRVMESGCVETNEEILQTAAGERVFHATKGPLRDARGNIFGVFGISRDITARKQAELQLQESRERLRLLIEHAPAALAMFDRNMCYLEVSRRWRDDYGLGDRTLVGLSHYDVFPRIPERWKEVHRRALAGETLTADEDCVELKEGVTQWLRWEVRPWSAPSGEIGGIVIFSEDITKRHLAEIELRRRHEELQGFNRAAIDRELRMIELKRQVNALAGELGREAPYNLDFTEAPPSAEMR